MPNAQNIISCRGYSPQIHESCWIAPNATIVGDVSCGENCSFWFNAVVRGDVHYIKMGHHVNVQDGAVIHCTYQKAPTEIGNYVSIGHNAIVHGCSIQDKVLIGMGAIVMDGAVIESGSVIAAGAVVLQNTIVKAGSLYAGVPAKFVKPVSNEFIEQSILQTAKNYVMYTDWFN